MSTKTLRKRIALVAVSAMGFGLLTSVAANAADGDMTQATTRATGTFGTVGSAVTTDLAQTVSLTTAGQVNVMLDAASGAYISLTGPCKFQASEIGSYATDSSDTFNSAMTKLTSNGSTDSWAFIVPTGTGTCVATSYASASAATAADKLTVSIVASTTIGNFSAADSFATVAAASSSEVTSSADDAASLRVANGSEGTINLTVHDENDVAMPSTTIITATVTGGPVVAFSSNGQIGTSASSTYGSSAATTLYLKQSAANLAQDAVVAISVNGVPWITKTIQFLGDAETVGLAEYYGVDGLVSATYSNSFVFNLKDSLGRYLTSKALTWTGASYNTSVTPSAATTGSSTTASTAGSFACSAVRGSNEIQLSYKNARGATLLSPKLKVNCRGAAYSFSASLDKSSYVPGEVATLTVTAKDSSGNPAADSSTIGASGYAVAIAGSNMTPVNAPTNADTFTAGAIKYKYIVGSTAGNYQFSVSVPNIDATAPVTIPYSIKTSSVSNEEVLAAIVKLIASINKQIAALQKALTKKK